MDKVALPGTGSWRSGDQEGALPDEAHGADATIGVLTAFAPINVVLIAALWALCRTGASEA